MYIRRHFWILTMWLCLVGIFAIPQQASFVRSAKASTITAATLPDADGSMIFEPNRGQIEDTVRFWAQGKNYTLRLGGENEARFSFVSPDGQVQQVSMFLVNSYPSPVISGQNPLTGTSHYLVGRDPAAWITQVTHYEQVRYEAVYPGIDMIYQGYNGQLQYDFVIAPGADPGLIRLAFDPIKEVDLLANGDLLLHLSGGTLRQHAPIAYQEVNGRRIEVASRFVVDANHEVSFALGSYNPTRPLVIDPILVYGSYLGGSTEGDYPLDIAVDSSGAMYITGYTASKDFPITRGAPGSNEPRSSIPWAFVTKFNPNGTLAYSTYLAGTTGESRGTSIVVDSSGSATVVGYTKSSTFPTTPGAYDTTFNTSAGTDAFVTRLTPDGTGLVFSTYLGGEQTDAAAAAALGADSSIYVAGSTTSSTFPTTPGTYITVFRGVEELFVTKFAPDGSLSLSTFYGPAGSWKNCTGIALDNQGAIYLAGNTNVPVFPLTSNAPDQVAEGTEGYVVKLSPAADQLIYSTFVGGNTSDEYLSSIAVDSEGAAYITGYTTSTDFPTTPLAFDPQYNRMWDAFVTKISPAGDAFAYSTYLGDYYDENGDDIAVDSTGRAYVIGKTDSTRFPTEQPYQLDMDGTDTFVTVLNPDGHILNFSTYFGGSGYDGGTGIALDVNGFVYITGGTTSTGLATPNGFQASYQGYGDGYVAKLQVPATAPINGTVTFGAPGGGTVPESFGVYTLPLILQLTDEGTLPSPITVPVTLSGTAEPGSDYSPGIPLSMSFENPGGFVAGTYSQTLSFTLNNDGLAEPDEDAILTLGTPTDPAISLGAISTHTFTITDAETSPPGSGALFTVNTTDDLNDGTCDDVHCSLREALTLANTTPGADTIRFAIPGGGVHTILLTSALPAVQDQVLIDGLSQPGATCNPWPATLLIELNGTNAGDNISGLTLSGSHAIVRGLVINNFSGSGISITGSYNNVACNYIGTDPNGFESRPNAAYYLSASTPSHAGIQIYNYNTAHHNTIGGPAPANRNLISGNWRAGIYLYSVHDNMIAGNFIGTDATGTRSLPNGDGIHAYNGSRIIIGADGNGVDDAAEGNVISGNNGHGLSLEYATTPYIVAGNLIGTDVSGSHPLGNLYVGIYVNNVSYAVIGSNGDGVSDAEEGNVISANTNGGIYLTGSDSHFDTITGNQIGTDRTGTQPLGNGQSGLTVYTHSTNSRGLTITGNTIAYNQKTGILVKSGIKNRLSRNVIFENGALGIDLDKGTGGFDGPTPNDSQDADTGSNQFQNFPLITGMWYGPPSGVWGTLNSKPGTTFTLEFFANESCDPTGYGEGQLFVGQTSVTTDSAGDASYFAVLSGIVPYGQRITVTAIDPDGNTSEFSPCYPVAIETPDFVVTNTNDSGPGSLRQAIIDANTASGLDLIGFDIPGPGPYSIQLASPLPDLQGATTLDGSTQRGYAGAPLVVIDGSALTGYANGLRVASASTLRALGVRGFSGIGINLLGGPAIVEGCDIYDNDTGILVSSSSNTIGGRLPDQPNYIYHNAAHGLSLSNSHSNVINGNVIGTNRARDAGLGNGNSGIYLNHSSTNQLGGATVGDGGNTIIGNQNGVWLDASSNHNAIAYNIITDNANEGVYVANSSENTISQNVLHRNGGLEIRLGDGQTPNDDRDSDSGPNTLQNTPLILGVSSGARTTLFGMLNSTPDQSFTLEFFANTACDLSGQGGGETFVGSKTIITNPAGNFYFYLYFSDPIPPGSFVTATATNSSGNTSEFSPCLQEGTAPPPPYGPIFTVNVTDDVDDGWCGIDHCSLREAINGANYVAGKDEIRFAIPGNGPYVIQTTKALPALSEAITIDASTQPGYVGEPLVILDSHGADNSLILSGGSSVVRGLSIINFGQTGIRIEGKNNNLIEGNYIGLSISGIPVSLTGFYGVQINQSDHNQIGGATAAAHNIIVGKTYGVYIYGDKSTYNKVQGNYINLDASGSVVALANISGVDVDMGSYNTIGGTKPGEGNVIAGSTYGVRIHQTYNYLEPNNNVVQGNLIGTDVTGTVALGVGIGIYTDGGDYSVIGASHPRGSSCTNGCNLIVGSSTGGDVGIHNSEWNGKVVGNFIGTDITGTVALGRFRYGIEASAETQVGRSADENSGNLIANYDECGIRLGGSATASANFIGTDVTGTHDLTPASRAVGICVTYYAGTIGGTSYNETGGGCRSACNLISGNWAGIYFSNGAYSVNVAGNYIGTNAAGTAAIGNQYGILLEGAKSIYIGDVSYSYPHGNLIGGNDVGILVDKATSNTAIHDNLIGVYKSGSTYIAIPNRIGIEVRGASTTIAIGGSTTGQGNVIAGNLEQGIYLWDRTATSSIIGNIIGVQGAPNGQHGVLIGQNQGSGNTITGANVIAYNTGNGVTLAANANAANSVLIAPNTIFSNGGLGIDLSDDGITLNDAGDADSGPNGRQNFPILTSVYSENNSTWLNGTLSTTPNTSITVRFYSLSRCDFTTMGEGETLFYTTTITTNAAGQAALNLTAPSHIAPGLFVTATATNSTNGTSEFSPCMIAGSSNTFVVSNTNDSGTGSLRQAILDANAHPGFDWILFSITGSGPGPYTIQPLSALPTITETANVNGCSQPNAVCTIWPINLTIQIDGTLAGPDVDGLTIAGPKTYVSGLVISRFTGYGLRISGESAQNNQIYLNFIGTDPTGTLPAGNQHGGILIEAGASGNQIYSPYQLLSNVISANGAGVIIRGASNNTVDNSLIGLDKSGTTPLGNAEAGVLIEAGAANNIIGRMTMTPASTNQIAYNDAGVVVRDADSLNNRVIYSRIYANRTLGIDLGGDGLTANDTNDADDGPNHLQNYPVLISAETRNGTRIKGTLHGAPNALFDLHFYSQPTCATATEGQLPQLVYLSAPISTDANGNAAFDLLLENTIPDGYGLTATATDANGNTSEFSACITVGAGAASSVVTSPLAYGPGSLYQAILDANALPGQDTITFALPGSGPQTIHISKPLPPINDSVIIDGLSQPDASCATWPPVLNVVVDGSLLATTDPALKLTASDSIVRGLVIGGFYGDAIQITGNRNHIMCNYIGMDASGTAMLPNGGSGIEITDGTENMIGTNGDGVNDSLERNMITGNASNFIPNSPAEGNLHLFGHGTHHNVIAGNIIGLDVTGARPNPLNLYGIVIRSSAQYNRIGTNGDGVSDDLERNVISGHSSYGILIRDSGTDYNVLAGNFIGTDLTGTQFIGNRYSIWLYYNAQHNRIGTDGSGEGFDRHEGNVISAYDYGILLDGANVRYNVISGNFIGTDLTGQIDLGSLVGIQIQDGAQNNLIGSNRDSVADDLEGNLIYYNGARVYDGAGTRGGIVFAYSTTSTLTPIVGNTIAYNKRNGIIIPHTSTWQIAILNNSIHSNEYLGIDLGGNGPTPNDHGDADTGPNGLQNYPEITAVIASDPGVLEGSLDSRPNTVYTIQFFSQMECDPTGFGEGEIYRGQITVTTDTLGEAHFSFPLTETILENELFTATATDPNNNTSEFSACRGATNQPPENQVPGTQYTATNEPLSFRSSNANVIRVADPDAGWNPILVALSVDEGTLTLSGISGLSFSVGDGTGDAAMTFTGMTTNINQALDRLVYTSPVDFQGIAMLTISSNDQGFSGPGGPQTDVDTVEIGVSNHNQPPVNALPGPQTTDEDSPLTFNASTNNAISISDPDAEANPVLVTLTVVHGVLTLNGTAGLTFDEGDGIDDPLMIFSGALPDINTALEGLLFTADADFNGETTLTVTTDDQGYSGFGGAQTDTDIVVITVQAVDDPPSVTVPDQQTAQPGQPLAFSAATGNQIVLTSVDGEAALIQVTLMVSRGELTLSSINGLIFELGDGTADEAMSFTGTLSDINTALNGLTYQTNYGGVHTLTVATDNDRTALSRQALGITYTIQISVPPSQPALLVPNDMLTNNNRPVLTWEPVLGAAHYHIQLASDALMTNLEIDTIIADTSYALIGPLPDNTVHFWRVLAITQESLVGEWSEIRRFKIDAALPAAPTLSSPRDRTNTTDTTAIFKWNKVSGATQYRIEVDDDPAFGSLANIGTGISTSTTYTVPNANALPYDHYYWRVQTGNTAGSWSDWSVVRRFTLTLLKSPANSTHLTDTTPTLSWTKPTGATAFEFKLDNSGGAVVTPFNTGLLTSYTPAALANGEYRWSVRVLVGGVWSEWMPVWTFTITAPPTVKPTLLTPKTGTAWPDLTPVFTWGTVTDGHHYQIQLDNNSNFSSPVQDVVLDPGVMTYTASELADGGKYFWRVRAINETGVAGAWGGPSNFTLTQLSAPMLTAPANKAAMTDRTPDFAWKAVLNAASYQVQISSDPTFLTVTHQGSAASNGYTVPDLNALPDGVYSWRVRAINTANIPGKWSSKFSFTVDNVGPAAPVLNNPKTTSGTSDTTPTYSWKSVSGGKVYHLQVTTLDDPNFAAAPLPIDRTGTTTNYTTPTALNYGMYLWRVQAQDALGNWGEFSSANRFAVTIHNTPKDGSSATSLQPTFSWNTQPGATLYDFELGNDADFSSPVWEHTPSAGKTAKPPAALTPGTYYWHVRAQVGSVWQPWMPTWTVIITPPLPGKPVLTTPVNKALLNDSTPTLNWNAVSGVTKYQVQIDNTTDFSSPAQDVTVSSLLNYIASELPDGKYVWRVRAINSVDAPGPWSSVFTLTIDTTPPTVPVILAPVDGTSMTNTKFNLAWSKVTDAARYEVQIDTVSTFPLPPSDVGNKTTYKPATPLARGDYFWRVRAVDKAGNVSAWTDYRTFKIVAGITAGDPTVTSTPEILPTEATVEPTAEPTLLPTEVPTVIPPTEPIYTLESDDPAVTQVGSWTTHGTPYASGGRYLYSSGSLTDALSFTFYGGQLDVIYVQHPALGQFVVEIDGAPLLLADGYAVEASFGLRQSIPLSIGQHTARLYPLVGTVAIDAFIIQQAPVTPPVEPTVIPTTKPTSEPTAAPNDTPPLEPTVEPTPLPTNTPLPILLPFSESFDNGQGWAASGAWMFDTQTAHSGAGWWADSTQRELISTLTFSGLIDLTAAQSPQLGFWQRGVLSAADVLSVEVSLDSGLMWWPALRQSSLSTDWRWQTVDLSAYRGSVIALRFVLSTTDLLPDGVTTAGFGLDDLLIQDVPPVPTEMPTLLLTDTPTEQPTLLPTVVPTDVPTLEPTSVPTDIPTEVPTAEPTIEPTPVPTEVARGTT